MCQVLYIIRYLFPYLHLETSSYQVSISCEILGAKGWVTYSGSQITAVQQSRHSDQISIQRRCLVLIFPPPHNLGGLVISIMVEIHDNYAFPVTGIISLVVCNSSQKHTLYRDNLDEGEHHQKKDHSYKTTRGYNNF